MLRIRFDQLGEQRGPNATFPLPGFDSQDKFRRRFGEVERLAAAQGTALRDLDFAALDALWDAAKASERDARAVAPAGSRAAGGSEEIQ